MSRFNPTRWPVRWQIAVLLIFTQIVAHISTIIMIDQSLARAGDGRVDLAMSISEPMLTALRMTDVTDVGGMTSRFSDLVENDDRFRLEDDLSFSPGALDEVFGTALISIAPPDWQSRMRVFSTDDRGLTSMLPMRSFAVAAQLPTGGWLVFEARGDSFIQRVPRTIALLGLFILSLTIMFLSVWAGSALVAPIGDLARGVERFAGDADAKDIPERGPVEVRRATRAFNKMRQRIRKLISDRSQTLASIGHDMRTPLTRLRLRLELLEQNPTTAAIEQDVHVLERMIDDALSFLRSEGRPLRLELLDIAILAKTVVDDYADQGHRIEYQGPQRLVLRCDRDLIRRVLDNLVGNAAKFAKEAHVILSSPTPDAVKIEVRDNGPGIPLDHRDRVLEPFARVEAVRSGTAQKSEGFGLGLAIARDLVERHGGKLALTDNQPKGLVVTLTLPKTAGLTDAEPDHD
ncbi:HAMP domain-containing sensor histidine kinase [Tabrizicola sp.]|uniref:HAMP domain-containing sensor histidine kinase n=1 Tax=Tabrizicola sp. TaxID=2005166 RepID=UPI003F2A4E71